MTVLRGVPAAKLDEPRSARTRAVDAPHRQPRRRQGAARQAVASQNDAWWNERNQVARDLLAAGRAADCLRRGGAARADARRGVRRAEFLAGWDCASAPQEDRRRPEAFPTLHDGVTTDGSKTAPPIGSAAPHEAAGRSKEANDWYSRASAMGQTFYGQLARAQAAEHVGAPAERSRRLRLRPPDAGRAASS